MPKTRNAYAFRDFDATRILQRPYFKNFREEYHFGDENDAEILESLNAADDDSARIIRRKIDCLQNLCDVVSSYLKRISLHGDKWVKYKRKLEKKIITDENADIKFLRERHRRASELRDKYVGYYGAKWESEVINDKDWRSDLSHAGIRIIILEVLLRKIIEQQEKLDGLQTHYRNIFAARLRKARKEMKLTQAELATRLNTSQQAVAKYETATREPQIAMLVKISKTLNCDVGWLVGAF